jgi:hypothetical protein
VTARARKPAADSELDDAVVEPNPALVPEPETTAPVSRTYVVCGSCAVSVDGRDHEPGGSFTAVLPPDLEAFLLGIGALTIKTKE